MKTLNKDSRRTEEVQDIVDRMPERFGRWVAVAVVCLTVLIIGAGFLIRYPDVVSGQITINSSQAPITLVANASGKLQLFFPESHDSIVQSEYIAVIRNAASTEDVRRVGSLLDSFSPKNAVYGSYKEFFPENVSLGELNLKYFTFLNALKAMCNYEEDNSFRQKKHYLTEYLSLQRVLQRQTAEEVEVYREKLDISDKWLHRNTDLRSKDMIPEFEMDQVRSQHLNARSAYQSLQKTMTSLEMQMADAGNQLRLLDVEQQEKENSLHLGLLSSFQDLTDNLKIWEEKYLFRAPFDGKVEFLKFWKNGQFVQAGEEVFSIVPRNTDIVGQMLLPSRGAGKVKTGNEVIIKLDNYPYAEFGSVEGRVVSVSLVTNETRTGQNVEENYLLAVALPRDLVTNYGEALQFQHELKGSADIVVKKRRLIQRLFDNLKYTTK